MGTTPNKSTAPPAPAKAAKAKAPDIATASVPDTLAALHVNPDTGLTRAEVDTGRKEHGYNEVARKKGHPILKFPQEVLGNFGVDARTDHGSFSRAWELC
jgi:magnesium-transporting ATPase (P-type)